MARRITELQASTAVLGQTDWFWVEQGGQPRKCTVVQIGLIRGAGSPEGVIFAARGTLYGRTDGGANTTLYVKESGDGTNTGWVAK